MPNCTEFQIAMLLVLIILFFYFSQSEGNAIDSDDETISRVQRKDTTTDSAKHSAETEATNMGTEMENMTSPKADDAEVAVQQKEVGLPT